MSRFRRPLRLLNLEDRLAPAVVAQFAAGNLTLTGDNTPNNVSINLTLPNAVNVMANSVNVGTFNVTGNLTVNLGTASDTVTVDLGGGTLPGNLSIGTGPATSAKSDFVTLANGGVAGKLAVTTAGGADQVFVGVGGSFKVGGNAAINLGSGADNFLLTPTSSIVGTLALAGVNDMTLNGAVGGFTYSGDGGPINLTFGMTSILEGNLTVTGTGGNDYLWFFGKLTGSLITNLGQGNNTVVVGGEVGGSVTVMTGAGNDIACINGSAKVLGNAAVLLGAGNNYFQIGGNAAVYSELTVTAGAGADSVNFSGFSFVGGNANLYVGDGANQYSFNDMNPEVGGSFRLTAGTGNDNIGQFSTKIGANASFAVGNGDNSITFCGSIYGDVDWRSGGGRDEVEILDAYPGDFRLEMGTGDDTLYVGPVAGMDSLYVHFDDNTDTITIPPTLTDVTIKFG
ncbi:MAG: hypothetical protein K1X57_00045 [Gemmataceae bacterium]|nr:hypothetical protein [Gemmataceae bacterium]